MVGEVLGKREVDLGSNDQEFWYWIRRSDPPYQVYCSYQALSEGKVTQLPFPFQPDWVLETLGMGNYGPASRYKLETEQERFKLVEVVRGPQGRDVKKVIVFNRRPARPGSPVITELNFASTRPERSRRTKRLPSIARIVPSSACVGCAYPLAILRAPLPSGRAAHTSPLLL